MAGWNRGLYEALITEGLRDKLGTIDGKHVVDEMGLAPADAPDRIALHVSNLIRRVVESIGDKARVEQGVRITRLLVELIDAQLNADVAGDRPVSPGAVLRAVLARLPDGRPEAIALPILQLLDTTVLTNAPDEPRVGGQLVSEVQSADRIDVVMAFIRRSGLHPFMEALRSHCSAGRQLRVLTTIYTGSTEAAALDQLRDIGAEVRVSYDADSTRLHAKAWLFHRASGFSTAYVGSSNLTHSAQITGLEWNVRLSGARNPDAVDKVRAVFESYWNSGDFLAYDHAQFLQQTERENAQLDAFVLSA